MILARHRGHIGIGLQLNLTEKPMRLTVDEDCKNAPKKRVLRDFRRAWAAGDLDDMAEAVSDDVRWKRVGEEVVEGWTELEQAVTEMGRDKATHLKIENIITHGATAALNGAIERESGSTYEFCDVYRFGGHGKNAKITEIASYAVDVPGD
jgi:ketosteroid isomerase-like protein